MLVTANASGGPGGPVIARTRDGSLHQPHFRPALKSPIQEQVVSGSAQLELPSRVSRPVIDSTESATDQCPK